ncbi:FtsX-like permease family protein [Modestobacter sp. NPDC049651]|uniref:ABC transporter permease n=1 Tax=unclassified Modestobacter TaxID=2643866 RepID=UPI0033F6229A
MRAVTLASLRAHAARLVASTLAIVIAVGFVVGTLVLNQTSRDTLLQSAGAQYVDTAAVVTSRDGSSLAGDVGTLAAQPGVRAVEPSWETSVQAVVPGSTGARYLTVDSVATDPALRWQQLSAGRLPTAPGEVAVSERAKAAVGDRLEVRSYDTTTGEETTSAATVVGVVDLRGDPTAGLYGQAFVTAEQAQQWGATDPTELRIAATPGADDEAVADAVRDALTGQSVTVRTGTGQAEQEAADLSGDTLALTSVLLVFATVAVLVAGLVIANTFAVLLAQRTRDLALLRCVGATSRQVRRSVLGEAALTGLAASVVGVAAGIGLAAGVSALVGSDSPIPLAGVSVPLYAVVVGVAVGTLTTLVAALAPTRAATRVAPLAALRPLDPAPLRSRGGVLRLVAGLLLAVGGAALMGLGVVLGGEDGVLAALAGGTLSFLGVVLLCQRAVPPVVAAAGRLLGGLAGVPGRLAAGNATRNPRRTAATATALLIGVTLTTAMVVGASSTRETAAAGLDAEYPTDVVVDSGGTDPLPAALPGRLAALDGVTRGTALTGATLTGPDGEEAFVEGIDPAAAAQVMRSTTKLSPPALDTVLLPEWQAQSWGVAAGDPVTLTAGDRSRTLTAAIGDTEVPLLAAADLAGLSPGAPVSAVWLRLSASADQEEVVDRVTDLAGTDAPLARVTGLASERAALDEVVDVLLLVVTGLLGIAVVIALIGVGNTLALSVVERRQESGLLRALGLTRGQLRALLAWESVLVAGVAAVLGVALGTAYGLVGAASVLGDVGEIVLSVPWLQVLLIVAVATVAGLLASVLPARRAARTPPVAAIAG